MIAIAQLGGYLHRQCDDPPGGESLWRGYARFHDMAYILRLRKGADARRRWPMRCACFSGASAGLTGPMPLSF